MPRPETPGPEKVFRLGKLAVVGTEARYALACDRAAADGYGVLYLASVVGDGAAVKGMHAALHTTAGKASLQPEGLEWLRPDGERKQLGGYTYPLLKHPLGYRKHVHRLDHGRAHALFLARDPEFLPSMDPESLWQALMGPRYTTPLLRPWAPWLTRRLAERGLLVPLYAHRARCGLLKATSEELDALASDGVRAGFLELSEESTAVELAAAV